jgi:surfactin synthase thioesterase subunit
MGAIIAFELTREIRRRGGRSPQALFVSGAIAPHMQMTRPKRCNLPDSQFRRELRELGGTPEELFEDPAILDLFLPTLRADVTALDHYDFQPEDRLDTAVHVFGGAKDPDIDLEQLEYWRDVTRAETTIQVFPGGHFFLFTESSAFVASMSARLRSVCPS